MAANLEELYPSRLDGSDDANGKRMRTRRFHAGVRDTDAARALFFATAGANIYPPDPSLVFDRLDAASSPTGVGVRLTAYYSNFNAGRFQVPTSLETDPKPEFGWNKREVNVELPVNIRQRVEHGETSSDWWTIIKQPVLETRILRTVKTRAYTEDTRSFDPIAFQINRLHVFGGIKYRFIDGAPARVNGIENAWDITYTWELDRGTYRPDVPADPSGVTTRYLIEQPVNITFGPADVNLIRPAYSRLAVVPSEDPANVPHYPIAQFPYTTDANGWQSLPGIPDLD